MDLPADFTTDPGFDPAEDHIGPFYYRWGEERRRYAFRADQRHCNANGIVHGGVLMTFADFALCMEATEHYSKETCVTVNFNCDFVAASHVGDLMECSARTTRKTGSMVFLRGEIFTGETIVMTYSAVVKRLPLE